MTEPRILNDRYAVGDLIGRGGMADVHQGTDVRLGREVAIKLLRRDLARDPVFQSRFRREAKAVAGLNHPSIVAVYDTGEEESPNAQEHDVRAPFIVMEYVHGRTLRDLVRSGELTVESSVRHTLGVLTALAYSHRKGIVHRDIKPANVMVTADGAIKVMDFGIARALADSAATMTQTQAVVGTAQYLSPEQARGESVDARSDLYSAGCLLYELLTGRPPFVGDSPVSVAYQHVSEEAPPPSELNSDVGPQLDRIVALALRKDRDDRYQDADAFAKALAAAAAGTPVPGDRGDATTALAVSAASTRALDTVEDNPTQTLASAFAPSVAAGGAADAPAGGPATGALGIMEDPGHPHPNGELAERRRYETSRRRAWITVFSVITLLVIGVGAWLFWNWNQQELARNASVAVPSVASMDQTRAQNALMAVNLVPAAEEVFDDSAPEGMAVGTDPAASQQAPVGSRVRLLISKGPEQATLPQDLAGQTEASVTRVLEELGLRVGDVTQENSASVRADRLIATNPKLGEQVKAGSSVDLVLSTGEVFVPNLLDLTLEQARKALADEAVGLSPNVVEVENTVLEPGTITKQQPEAGTSLEQGGTVVITVTKEPDAPVEPAPSEPPPPSAPASSAPADSSPPAGSDEPDNEGNGNAGNAGGPDNAGGPGNSGRGNASEAPGQQP
ncbi:Stk1 family PASTA domain-containing Ser/Thr kinase [Arthrobacter sp. KK5.5]|uniref:Stk1 family PASTA domain-containing Ser/Thr kinase n=1 Tax=Arthrobacter sp. KK5.5 TaxID=3373084 RepID=UPI003EE4A58A